MTPPAFSLLADENFRGGIVSGVRARRSDLDLVAVHEVGLAETDDRVVLEWAASEDRIVLTHDERTMIAYAYARIRAGLPMPGIVLIRQSTPIGIAVESLLLLLGAGAPEDVRNRVLFLPF